MPNRHKPSLPRRLALLVPIFLATLPTAARQAPPIETGEKLVEIAIADGHPTMRDAATGDVLLDYRGVPLFDAQDLKGAVEPGVKVQIQPAGFDLVYTFRNAGDKPAPMATLKLGVITLGEHALYQDMRRALDTLPADPGHFPVRWLDYPGSLYSPVTVFRNDRIAVGISLQYPILEYQHDVRLTLKSPGGRLAQGTGGRGFEVDHALSAPSAQAPETPGKGPARTPRNRPSAGDGKSSRPGAALPVALSQPAGRDDAEAEEAEPQPRGPWPDRPGLIGPGMERTYVVSVRVTRKPEEWVRTLTPYRDFFRRIYGGVTYKRHTGAINGVVMANFGRISPDNPYGWVGGVPRPDKGGYKPWAD